jgi:hypothetical protein
MALIFSLDIAEDAQTMINTSDHAYCRGSDRFNGNNTDGLC